MIQLRCSLPDLAVLYICNQAINQAINQIPIPEARVSGTTANSVFNSKIRKASRTSRTSTGHWVHWCLWGGGRPSLNCMVCKDYVCCLFWPNSLSLLRDYYIITLNKYNVYIKCCFVQWMRPDWVIFILHQSVICCIFILNKILQLL